MNSIRFIKDFFWDEELYAHGRGKGPTELFLHQGDLDGACAVYSLMMMLMIHKKVNRKELEDRTAAQRMTGGGYNSFMRLQDYILGELPGLYQNGYYFTEVADKLHQCFKKEATASVHQAFKKKANSKAKKELGKIITETINAGYPVEIGFTSKKGYGHAVIAIGYTNYYTDLRLFCLDPSFDLGKTAFWNSIIDVDYFDPGAAIYSDKYFTPDGESDVITVDEILTIDVE